MENDFGSFELLARFDSFNSFHSTDLIHLTFVLQSHALFGLLELTVCCLQSKTIHKCTNVSQFEYCICIVVIFERG